MSEEIQTPESGGVNVEQEPAQIQKQEKLTIKSYFYYDSRQDCEYSENIIPLLLPSGNVIFIKRRIKGDQILIPLKQFNNKFLKLWKDSKNHLLYNLTTISEPLFTHLFFVTKNIYGTTKSIDENGITLTIVDNDIQYEIQLNEEFFKNIECSMNDMLALALYHLYISYII